MKIYKNLFDQIASLDNIVVAWEEFRRGKGQRADVQAFEFSLEQSIFSLHRDLLAGRYFHGPYTGFYVRDPKVRHIHRAEVRDRVLHHAVFRILNPIFEKTFIPDSFSCRIGKGTHRGVLAVEKMIRRESRNYTRRCFVLKCDVRRFFDSINHEVLLAIIRQRIIDPATMWLIEEIIGSFSVGRTILSGRYGLPIGNLTSQLFANVYMNEFDQFVKHDLKLEHYARYTDDFVVVSADEKYLEELIGRFQQFIAEELKLTLHPKKVFIRNVGQGVDFLGYVMLPRYRVLLQKTERRILRKLSMRAQQFSRGEIGGHTFNQSLQSYLGVLSHANAYRLGQVLRNQYWIRADKLDEHYFL